MSITKQEAESRINDNRPILGFVRDGDQLYGPAEGSFPSDDLSLTRDFEEYADRTKESWSFFRYLSVVFKQFAEKHLKRNTE